MSGEAERLMELLDVSVQRRNAQELSTAWMAFDSGYRAGWEAANPGKPVDYAALAKLSRQYVDNLVKIQEQADVAFQRRVDAHMGSPAVRAVPQEGWKAGGAQGHPPGGGPQGQGNG